MAANPSLQVAPFPDLAQPLDALLAGLSLAERRQAQTYPTERRRRHFVLGRRAAHLAIRRVLGSRASSLPIEVLAGPDGKPFVRVAGTANVVSVSISHAAHLAIACAWPSAADYSAGVDAEQIRPTEVAQSEYAFSRRERALFSRAPEGRVLAGLAAWTVKEAVWKALWPKLCCAPVQIEIKALNLALGHAAIEARSISCAGSRDAATYARVNTVDGPDGAYLVATAEISIQ